MLCDKDLKYEAGERISWHNCKPSSAFIVNAASLKQCSSLDYRKAVEQTVWDKQSEFQTN